ncbi:MAG: peptidoglycan-binding domain-containing protein [Candidatus Paceibacterota bacterium]|jgi:hypothetical protein
MSNFKSKFLLGVMTVAIMFVGVVAVKATPAAAADCTITATLRVGSKGEQVKCLQATVGVTADGKFGKMTAAAVKVWQASKGLVADGIFGAKSRAVFVAGGPVVTPGNLPAGCNAAQPVQMYSMTLANTPCIAGAVAPATTGPLAVALSSDNPAGGNVLSGQALADLAHFTFTGTGTLSQVTLQRTGLSVSADVSNVYLFDGNQRLTDGASVNTAGNIVFNNVNIAVAGSRTLSVKVDMAATTTSVNLGVTLTGYMVTGSTTASAVSVAGNLFYVSAAPTGGTSATLNATTVSSGNVNAGSMNYTVWANGLQVNGRAGLLKGLNLHFIGSAPTDSLANAKLFLDGTAIGTPSTVNAAGYLYFDLGAGVALGVSTHTLEVHADVIKGSNRNFQLSLQNSSDLMITDSQIGININAATAVTNGVAGTITVNPGSVTVNVDPSFNTVTKVTGGATNVTIAKYKFTAYGEDMKITSLTALPVLTGMTPAANGLNNVALYANGGQIGSSQNFVATALVYALGSSLIIPAGTTTIVEVRADTINATPANYTLGTITVSLKGSTSNAQGMSSQNLTTAPSTSGVSSGALTVGAATATVAVSTGLNNKNVISNTAKTKIGSFVVQAGASEGVRVTNLQVGLVFGAAAATYASGTINAVASNSITFSSTANIAVGDVLTIEAGGTDAVGTVTSITSTTVAVVNFSVAGSTTGTPSAVTGTSGPMTLTNVSNLYTSDDTATVVGNPTATNNFSVNYTLAPSTSKTIDVYADLGGLNAGTVQSTLKITAVGGTTNVALVGVGADGINAALVGQVMTVAAGSVATPTLTTASMVPQFVVGGASPSLVTYNFVATNGDATVTELIFTVVTTATAIDHVCVGSVCAPVIGGVATVAGLNIVVPAGYAGKDVLVTPTYSLVGIGQQTSNSAATMNLTSIKYTIGNTTTTATPTVTGRAMTLVGSYPTVTLNTATRSGLSNTLVKLADVTVTANAAGAIKLKQLPIVTTSTGVATVATGTDNITVKDGSGNVLNATYSITNTTFVVAANGTSGSVPLVFGTPYNIPAGTSVTFGIYATAATVSGAVNTTSLSTKLGTNTTFLFDDVNGNVANIPANDGTNTNILNYPVDGSVITN